MVLEVSLGELDSAGPINAGAEQEWGWGDTLLRAELLERGQSQGWC